MRPAIILALLASLALTACQQRRAPEFQVEQSRTYDLPKETVWSEIVAFLRNNDIEVRRADIATGMIEADRLNYQDEAWAWCERTIGTDRDGNRPRRARQVLDRSLSLDIAVREVGAATQVTLDPTFTERQIHPWRNLPFETGCISTGALERALLEAIAPPASAITPPNAAGTN